MKPNEKVYYCETCGSMVRPWFPNGLPLSGPEYGDDALVGGCCHICGQYDFYAGWILRKDLPVDTELFYEKEVETA